MKRWLSGSHFKTNYGRYGIAGTIAQRVGFSAATVACVAAIAGTMSWAAQPDYVAMAGQLTPQKSTEIAGILDTENIRYSLNFSGSTVSVPSSDVARARMALASIISPENEADVPAAGLFPGSPGEEEDRRLAGLEKQIERNIRQIRVIESATVKVRRPNPSPFVTDQSPVTAAVVIKTRAGETIPSTVATSIIANVAGSVPGLTADNIVMTDTNGRQYGGNSGMDADVAEMAQLSGHCAAFRTVGKLRSVRGLMRADMPAFVGETCAVSLRTGEQLMAEVVGFDETESQLMCFDSTAGLQPGLEITATGHARAVPVGRGLLGRVIDGIGRPIDGAGPLRVRRWRAETATVPDAMQRTRITEPLVTGQRVIDGLLTIGRGQRVGLFAGSGVGKSTLMGEIAKTAESDVNVIAMVGERGREVRPFIEDCLGEVGLARSVVVVATSDQTPLMRIKAVLTAATIAEEFRDQARTELKIIEEVIHREHTEHRREQLKREDIQLQEQASQAYHRTQQMRSEP